MAHPSPRIGKVGVAPILAPRELPFREVFPQCSPGHVKERPDDEPYPPPDGRDAARTRASEQFQEHSLGLVVSGMGGGHGRTTQPLPYGFQGPIPLPAPPRFRRSSAGPLRRQVLHNQLHPEAVTQFSAVCCVAVRRDPALVVMHMCRGHHAPEIGDRFVEQAEESNRVRTPRERDQDGAPEDVGEVTAKSGGEAVQGHGRGAGEWTRTTDTGLMRPLLCL